MKLLIGGKNRNIHFRKDKSAFYKSNGEEHDVSKLFKKVGGLKKQYEEYLVSDNDLTERYKALSISGGSSVSRKKPVPINKKKRKGKKFVGGMTVSAINIDIDAAPGGVNPNTIDSNFRVYLKLIGAYYLALLTESDSFIFGDSALKIRDFHKNKLNNSLIIDFMENPVADERYLPYLAINKYQNLVFCNMLLKLVKAQQDALKRIAIGAVALPALAFTEVIINEIVYNALDVSNSLETIPVVAGFPVQPKANAIGAPPGGPGLVAGDILLSGKLIAFAGTVARTAAIGNGPDIIVDMNAYQLPEYADNNPIQAQFYRCIIADLTVAAAGGGGGGGAPVHPFIRSTLDPLPDIDLADNLLIAAFETNYVAIGGTVQPAIVAAAGGAASALGVAAATAVDNAAGAGAELKKIPYKLFQRLILQELDANAATVVAIGGGGAGPVLITAATAGAIDATDLSDAYYNTIVIEANNAVVNLPMNVTASGGVNPATHGKGLFALTIPSE